MIHLRPSLLLATLLGAAAAPAVAVPKQVSHPGIRHSISGGKFVVLNNTSTALRCTETVAGPMTLPAGGQWSRSRRGAEATTQFRCIAPADGVGYAIHPGTRYSLLRSKSGIHLVAIGA